MPQNRPDLIKRFIGVSSNLIVHKVLIRSEIQDELRDHYVKEVERDMDIALKYREKINPAKEVLPVPGGPYNIRELMRSASIARASFNRDLDPMSDPSRERMVLSM